ncbi:MAG: isoprenylcysteine carboxylmethyltransferase family protein [Thioalkalivibrio sp.]|nr:isoprenylcysteine carboxylmethyltransferase family protein [Thioalkalivibrio sp.]
MFVRALLAYLALPGAIAFAVPALIAARLPHALSPSAIGVVVFILGTALHLSCLREFFVKGKGTLAPWAPPVHLVTTGLYRYTRNPMYVAVLLILTGWALAYRSPALALYAGVVAVAFHLRVTLVEEPALEHTFGKAWHAYRQAVHRWLSHRLWAKRGGQRDDA